MKERKKERKKERLQFFAYPAYPSLCLKSREMIVLINYRQCILDIYISIELCPFLFFLYAIQPNATYNKTLF